MATCGKCEGTGQFDFAEFVFNCDQCEAGFHLETARMQRMVKHHEREARKLRAVIKKRLAN